MKVSEIMTKPVRKLHVDDNVGKAIEMFSKYSHGGFPVVDKNDFVVGIVSESDLLKIIDIFSKVVKSDSNLLPFILGVIKDQRNFDAIRKNFEAIKTLPVSEIMEENVLSIDKNEDVYSAARIMNKHKIHRLPVVDNNRLVGIITKIDIIRSLGK